MSKKTLLSESQVRQFMKLAKLTPLTPGFVEGLTENTTEDLDEVRTGSDPTPNLQRARRGHGRGTGATDGLEEASEEAELHATEDELSDEDSEADREGDEIDDLEGDLDAADAGDGAEQMISVGDLMDALTSALEDVTGQPVEASVEDEVEADVELDAADDLEVDAADMEADTDMEMDDMLHETGAKDDGESKGDKGKDKEDPEDRDYSGHGMRKGDESDTDPGDKDDTWRKGEKSKTHAGLNKEGVEATDALVEQITKRVAARILKSALAKK